MYLNLLKYLILFESRTKVTLAPLLSSKAFKIPSIL